MLWATSCAVSNALGSSLETRAAGAYRARWSASSAHWVRPTSDRCHCLAGTVGMISGSACLTRMRQRTSDPHGMMPVALSTILWHFPQTPLKHCANPGDQGRSPVYPIWWGVCKSPALEQGLAKGEHDAATLCLRCGRCRLRTQWPGCGHYSGPCWLLSARDRGPRDPRGRHALSRAHPAGLRT